MSLFEFSLKYCTYVVDCLFRCIKNVDYFIVLNDKLFIIIICLILDNGHRIRDNFHYCISDLYDLCPRILNLFY